VVAVGGRVTDAILRAFDLLELDGEDLRPLPLGQRKARLARRLARAPPGIEFNAHTDEDGATVFRHACAMGLEGIVSKRTRSLALSGVECAWIPPWWRPTSIIRPTRACWAMACGC
jgi:bifunctional non-homologous end joining protein LigD